MSNLTYTDSKESGEFMRATLGYRGAVRVGDRIECSGQGGWTIEDNQPKFPSDIREEIDKAFQNVESNLRAAGGKGWEQVFRLNSYHTELTFDISLIMSDCFKKYMPNHQVIWTEIGVKQLGAPDMRVELEVSAFVG